MAHSISHSYLKNIFPDVVNYNVFIETGTRTGGTTFKMSPYFDTVHTVELSETLYLQTKSVANSKQYNNIHFHLGDSAKVLYDILPTINQKAIFYLDGHWSAGNTARGPKDCPVIEELQSINKLHDFDSLIIIDDFRLFGTDHHQDWSEITVDAVLACFSKEKISRSWSHDDRYYILLNA